MSWCRNQKNVARCSASTASCCVCRIVREGNFPCSISSSCPTFEKAAPNAHSYKFYRRMPNLRSARSFTVSPRSFNLPPLPRLVKTVPNTHSYKYHRRISWFSRFANYLPHHATSAVVSCRRDRCSKSHKTLRVP